MPPTQRVTYQGENASAAKITLTPDELLRLGEVAAQTSGPRYNERGLSMVER